MKASPANGGQPLRRFSVNQCHHQTVPRLVATHPVPISVTRPIGNCATSSLWHLPIGNSITQRRQRLKIHVAYEKGGLPGPFAPIVTLAFLDAQGNKKRSSRPSRRWRKQKITSSAP
jgi:hypothetical protein